MRDVALATDAWSGVQDLFGALLALIGANPPAALGIGAVALIAILLIVLARPASRRARATAKPAAEAAPVIVPMPALSIAPAPASAAAAPAPQPAAIARSGQGGRPLPIFLSSTSVDLEPYRTRTASLVRSMGQFAVTMDRFPLRADLDATSVSLVELGNCDIYILLLAWRYGHVPDGQRLSVTHQEYREARRLGLPCFVFLADERTDANLTLFPQTVRDASHRDQVLAFRAETQQRLVGYFTTIEDLADKVVAALHQYLLDRQAATLARPDATGRVVALADMPAHGRLVGREIELPKLLERLSAGEDVGVFAIEGMGGVGKTALAAEAARRLASDERAFPGGVVWLACAGLEGESGLLALLAQAARTLGHDDLASLTDLATLRQRLAAALPSHPRTLLTLDNIEPGLDAEVALRTLTAPGHTTLLLTAREQVAPHLVYALPLAPLPAPDAALLFAQRLGQATGGARPTPDDGPGIPGLVAAVGGLPLAVELLAADAGTQGKTLAALRAELDAAGVNAGAFHADPKRTVTKTFDRSWETLPARQRRLFAGLGLLPEAGFPRAAAQTLAQAAAQGDATPADAPDPAGDVAALVRTALVEPLAGERLRLHPLLRAYARDRLSALGPQTSDALGDAMLAYWLDFAQAHDTNNGQDPAAMDAQEAEAPGLMAALAWAHDHARWRPLLSLGHALNDTWETRGRRAELFSMTAWEFAASKALNDVEEQEWAIHELAMLHGRTGQVQKSREYYTSLLELAMTAGNKQYEMLARHGLAVLDANTGEPQRARAGFEQALALARELGDTAAIRAELHGLAVLDAETGEPQRARAGYEEALALARELGDVAAQATELSDMGVNDRLSGNLPHAREELTQALALAQQIEDALGIARTYNNLGFLARDEGDTQQACAHFREALARFERLSSPEAEEPRSMLRRLGCEP